MTLSVNALLITNSQVKKGIILNKHIDFKTYPNVVNIKMLKKKRRRPNEFKSNSWSFWYSCRILAKCQVLKYRWFMFTAILRATFLELKLLLMKVMHITTSSGVGRIHP